MDEFTNTPNVENPNAVSVNLCPDCGVPPMLFPYLSGRADCECLNTDCESYDVEHAESWQAALQQWNENTAKAYVERSESPISDNGEHEPARVENRPQDGPECDTREKVLADLERLAHEWHDYDGNFMRIYNHVAYAQVKELLDRQAAISEREYWDNCCQNHVDYDEEYKPVIDELTAERDNWANCYDSAVKRGQNLLSKIDELTAERDDLRSRLKTQANNFAKLERDNAKLRDTLERVRKLVGDAQ